MKNNKYLKIVSLFLCCFLIVEGVFAQSQVPSSNPEKVSFYFQNIAIIDVLQLLTEFMEENVVISTAVKGNITLRLNEVSWDEALNFILQTQGLAQRKVGNIIMIAPAAEIAAQQQTDLQTKQALDLISPLTTQSFQINYGKVDAYYDLLKDPKQTLLSSRGRVVKLNNTNTLIVEDIAEKLNAIAMLFEKMDRPARQVLIEARIIYISTSYEKRLGVNWGSSGSSSVFKGFNMDLSPGGVLTGAKDPTGMAKTGIGVLKLGNLFGSANLDLELQAIEAEGKGELISSPRIVTSNNITASIQQGQQIPYTASAASGGTTTQFVNALLRLEVTPQITPNNKLALDLTVNQDQVDTSTVAGTGQQPPINTRQLKTNILVDHGQTIVLGGIYERNEALRSVRLPWISKIPLIGNLFKSKTDTDTKTELLIFLTPKIIDVADEP